MSRQEALYLAVLIFLVAALFGAQGYRAGKTAVRQEAVQRGFAEYNQTNGVWQWKESK